LEQDQPFHRIILNLPHEYKRLGAKIDPSRVSVPGDSRIIINRCEDSGPGTKLLGALEVLDDEEMVVLVDDDMEYERGFLRKLLQATEQRTCAASFHVYEVNARSSHRVGQGADGFAIPCASLGGIKDYFKMIGRNYHLFLNDDLWISFFLEIKGVKINHAGGFAGEVGIDQARTEIPTSDGGLVNMTGRYARWRSIYRGIRYLERKRPWLETAAGIGKSPGFSVADKFADIVDLIRR
jgi:glycosyltransferase involved in cell wall biosynthesis